MHRERRKERAVEQRTGASGQYSRMLERRIAGTDQRGVSSLVVIQLTWAMAKRGISKQIKESTRASDMCSASVYGPTTSLVGVRIRSYLRSEPWTYYV